MLLSQLAVGVFQLPTDAQGWIFECVGILASLFVLLSFFWSNEKLTRIINMVGCIVFVIYAILIGSLSVLIMNGACFILHVVKLVQMRKRAQSDKCETANETTETDRLQGQEEASNEQPPQE